MNKSKLFLLPALALLVACKGKNGPEVSTFAGSGKQGSADGKGASASFFFPAAIAADAGGTVYLADTHNNMIRKISADGTVTTLAGRVSEEIARHRDTVIKLENPYGVAVDKSGNVYVSDWEKDVIKKVGPGGTMSV